MKSAAIIAMCIVFCASCASVNSLDKKLVMVGDTPVTYVFGISQDHSGIHAKVVDRYDANGNLMARDSFVGEGIAQKIIPAAISGGAFAGGMVGAASALRPDQTSISQNGGSSTALSHGVGYGGMGGSGGSSINTNTNETTQLNHNPNINLNPKKPVTPQIMK